MKRATVVVENDGTIIDLLPVAKQGSVVWELGQPDRWSFDLPAGDDRYTSVVGAMNVDNSIGDPEPFREVLLKRGRDILSWGPVLSPSWGTSQATVSVAGADCLEYYDRRFVGFAQRPNMAQIDVDFSGWVKHVANVQEQSSGPETADTFIETAATHPVTGETCLHLHDVDPNLMVTAWHQWDVNFTAVGFERAATFTVEVYVDDAVAFSPNFQKAGPEISTYPLSYASVFTDFGPTNAATVDEKFPVGPSSEPERLSCSVTIPPATTGTIVLKCFAVKGDVYYTNPVCDVDNGLVFIGEEQTDIAWKLSDHITANPTSGFVQANQNPNFPYTSDSYNWSDLNIKTDTPSTSTPRTRKYLFSSRTTGLGALNEFPQLEDGFEFWIDYSLTGTPRTFKTASRKGEDRPEMPLRWGPFNRGNVKAVQWNFAGERAANAIVETLGGGLGQPEGSFLGLAAYTNGLTLGEVLRAPAEARPNSLNARAEFRSHLDVYPVTVAVTIPASPYFEDGLRVGDRVPFAYHEGDVHVVQELMWVRKMELTADDDLILSLSIWPGTF